MQRRRRRPRAVYFRSITAELLEPRELLAADVCTVRTHDFNVPAAATVEVEPRYAVNHPPRLQPGNAPLVGTPAFNDTDQIDLLWQTQDIGSGIYDRFDVAYRLHGDNAWQPAPLNMSIATGAGTRTIHSATLSGLAWDTDYQYRVDHWRADALINRFEAAFTTRISPGTPDAFSFVAYGDSANLSRIELFRDVQRQINQQDPDFALLLGDNIYTFATHDESDGRFDPTDNPEAVEWNASKIDYFAVGNHDLFNSLVVEDRGQTSRDLFSVPVPVEGVNGYATPPDIEQPEHNYSFDYGDVHFTTIDSNIAESLVGLTAEERGSRIDALLDYAVADIQSSQANWKIAYVHHPVIGTEKAVSPNDVYFQKMVTRLNAVDVDLLLVAHSHTYSWTYPIQGFGDANSDGSISFEEVDYVPEPSKVYDRGAGLIQVVSGVGGTSLRSAAYAEPVFAQAYSAHRDTATAEYGFARVDVTPGSLTVSYVSAADGEIVGDINQNGRQDEDEPDFGQFRILDRSITSPDFDGNGSIDAADIDRLAAAIRIPNNTDARFDLNQDGVVSEDDMARLLRGYLAVQPGDANLDGVFSSRDLVLVFQAGEFEDDLAGNSGWMTGDWNGDGEFNASDLVAAFTSGFSTA